ncbi:hypothetical protein HJFPF1_06770 [Paramyrothecium foliicola]|nr:hypothetical protein HJFPF1_06770 [Paramyrothecium foliicola]
MMVCAFGGCITFAVVWPLEAGLELDAAYTPHGIALHMNLGNMAKVAQPMELLPGETPTCPSTESGQPRERDSTLSVTGRLTEGECDTSVQPSIVSAASTPGGAEAQACRTEPASASRTHSIDEARNSAENYSEAAIVSSSPSIRPEGVNHGKGPSSFSTTVPPCDNASSSPDRVLPVAGQLTDGDGGRREKLRRTSTQILMHFSALCLLSVVIVFVETSYTAEDKSRQNLALSPILKTDVSTMITVLRASQGILSTLATMLLNEAFVGIQWAQISSSHGLPYLSLLALSPTTGLAGVGELIKARAVKKTTKIWAISRVLLIGFLWLSGLTLFFNTSLITVYDTSHSYEVTAGVGAFNGSLVEPFKEFLHSLAPKYTYETLPYTYFAAAYTLVVNPLISTVSQPVNCQPDDCASYLLSGGLMMVAPWAPQAYPDYPMIKVAHAPSIQIDFTRTAKDGFEDVECDDFGEDGTAIGIRLCLAEEQSNPGLFVCSGGFNGGICELADPAPNITTEVTFYTRKASIIAARSNYSIMSITETTPPVQVSSENVNLPAYRNSLRWLLNYTAADLPPPSSIAQSFWSSQKQLGDLSTQGLISQNFQSILAFPFWLFNSNNWGNTQLQENQTVSSLPSEFYTQAYVVAPYIKIKFDFTMFITFLVLQVLAIVFAFGAMLWVWSRSALPLKTSSFPLYDIWFKADVRIPHMGEAFGARNSEVIKGMKDARVLMA